MTLRIERPAESGIATDPPLIARVTLSNAHIFWNVQVTAIDDALIVSRSHMYGHTTGKKQIEQLKQLCTCSEKERYRICARPRSIERDVRFDDKLDPEWMALYAQLTTSTTVEKNNVNLRSKGDKLRIRYKVFVERETGGMLVNVRVVESEARFPRRFGGGYVQFVQDDEVHSEDKHVDGEEVQVINRECKTTLIGKSHAAVLRNVQTRAATLELSLNPGRETLHRFTCSGDTDDRVDEVLTPAEQTRRGELVAAYERKCGGGADASSVVSGKRISEMTLRELETLVHIREERRGDRHAGYALCLTLPEAFGLLKSGVKDWPNRAGEITNQQKRQIKKQYLDEKTRYDALVKEKKRVGTQRARIRRRLDVDVDVDVDDADAANNPNANRRMRLRARRTN